MIRHCRDYVLSEIDIHKTLCGLDIGDVLRSTMTDKKHTLAFSWCSIEKINCDLCCKQRVRLEASGKWPD